MKLIRLVVAVVEEDNTVYKNILNQWVFLEFFSQYVNTIC